MSPISNTGEISSELQSRVNQYQKKLLQRQENKLNLRWRAWCQDTVQPSLWQRAYRVFDEEITPRYKEEHRKYHTLEHIADCLQKLEEVAMVKKRFSFSDGKHENYFSPTTASVLEFAFWFHDIVYDTHCSDNEEQSVKVMQTVAEQLQLPESFGKEAAELILVSRIGSEPKTDLEKLQKDIDYSIMGSSVSIYDRYAERIKFEYSWVPEEVFREKRANFLQRTLTRAEEQGLFHTPFFRNMYEAAARENIKRELQQLRGG